MEVGQVEAVVRESLPGARIMARDTTGTGDHFHVVVIDTSFEGLQPVKRQRIVLAPFKALIATGDVHALDLVALTPQEAEERGVEVPD